MKRGTELSKAGQQYALSAFVHRFTKEHKPRWATRLKPDGKPYVVQFQSDADWLANTEFSVTSSGALDRRAAYCHCHPTWPDNPGLRREQLSGILPK